MAELRKMKSGSHIAFIFCILFLESRLYCIKATEIPSERMCSEEVLVLLQHLGSSPCNATTETNIISYNRIQDRKSLKLGERCILEKQCKDGSFPLTCLKSRCSCTDEYVEYKGQCLRVDVSNGGRCTHSFQCAFAGGVCSTSGTCSCRSDLVYDIFNNECVSVKKLREKCDSDEECGSTFYQMQCLENQCLCVDGFTEIHGHCYEKFLSFGNKCAVNEQCAYHGGYCNRTCSCGHDYEYSWKNNSCIRDVNHNGGLEMQQSESDQDTVVVGAAVGSLVIGVIIGVMTTLGAMFLLKRSRAMKDCDTEKPSVGQHEVYEDKLQMVSKQDTYEQIGRVEEKNNTIKLNSESVYHVVEPTPSAPIEDKINKQEEESVYNHLFEKVEQSETSTYDNPHEICTGRDNQAFVEEGKAKNARHDHQAFVEERMSRDTSLPEENKLAGFHRRSPNITNENSETDDYFILECNK